MTIFYPKRLMQRKCGLLSTHMPFYGTLFCNDKISVGEMTDEKLDVSTEYGFKYTKEWLTFCISALLATSPQGRDRDGDCHIDIIRCIENIFVRITMSKRTKNRALQHTYSIKGAVLTLSYVLHGTTRRQQINSRKFLVNILVILELQYCTPIRSPNQRKSRHYPLTRKAALRESHRLFSFSPCEMIISGNQGFAILSVVHQEKGTLPELDNLP